VALNYLLGGADSVLANLWDVTDRDIDKLSMECMRLFFGGCAVPHSEISGDTQGRYQIMDEERCTGGESHGILRGKDARGKEGDSSRGRGKNTGGSRPSSSIGFSFHETPEGGLSLAHALSASRKICKLKNAVGCAPVIYGIPRKLSG
jgi:separase